MLSLYEIMDTSIISLESFLFWPITQKHINDILMIQILKFFLNIFKFFLCTNSLDHVFYCSYFISRELCAVCKWWASTWSTREASFMSVNRTQLRLRLPEVYFQRSGPMLHNQINVDQSTAQRMLTQDKKYSLASYWSLRHCRHKDKSEHLRNNDCCIKHKTKKLRIVKTVYS